MSFETEAYADGSVGGTDESEEPTSSDDEFIVDDDYVEYMSDDSESVPQQAKSSVNTKRDRIIYSDSEDEDRQEPKVTIAPKNRGRPSGNKKNTTNLSDVKRAKKEECFWSR